MQIRKYTEADCAQLAKLFYDTVHTVNAQDDSPLQLLVWADGQINLLEWNRSFLEHTTLVAVEGPQIVGFADITSSGYLDRLFVHKDAQRQGIASALCDPLETLPGLTKITVHASITAKNFFEKRNYQVKKRCTAIRKGILLPYYLMEKESL